MSARLIIAVATAFLARSMFANGSGNDGTGSARSCGGGAQHADMPHVLVATKALPVGTIVGPDAYRFQPWPKELVENAYFIEGKADVNQLAGRWCAPRSPPASR